MTYWVEYEYTYTLHSGEEIQDSDSGRFHCCKKNIKKAVEEKIKQKLEYENFSDLKFNVYDFYPTTDCEV